MHALGTYSAALLLIQKLFFSIRPELLRSALILAGHLLRGACAPAADVQVLLALLVQTRVFHYYKSTNAYGKSADDASKRAAPSVGPVVAACQVRS